VYGPKDRYHVTVNLAVDTRRAKNRHRVAADMLVGLDPETVANGDLIAALLVDERRAVILSENAILFIFSCSFSFGVRGNSGLGFLRDGWRRPDPEQNATRGRVHERKSSHVLGVVADSLGQLGPGHRFSVDADRAVRQLDRLDIRAVSGHQHDAVLNGQHLVPILDPVP
jgi:hypothetical protein